VINSLIFYLGVSEHQLYPQLQPFIGEHHDKAADLGEPIFREIQMDGFVWMDIEIQIWPTSMDFDQTCGFELNMRISPSVDLSWQGFCQHMERCRHAGDTHQQSTWMLDVLWKRGITLWLVVSNIVRFFTLEMGCWCGLTDLFGMGWNHQQPLMESLPFTLTGSSRPHRHWLQLFARRYSRCVGARDGWRKKHHWGKATNERQQNKKQPPFRWCLPLDV